MRTHSSRVKIGPREERVTSSVMSDEVEQGAPEFWIVRQRMIEFLANDPNALAIEGKRWERLVIRHDGGRWVAETSAIAEVLVDQV